MDRLVSLGWFNGKSDISQRSKVSSFINSDIFRVYFTSFVHLIF